MMRYYLKFAGAMIGIFLAGILGIIIFEDIWFQVGLGAAILVVCGGLILFAWFTSRKDRERRAGLDDLPPI